MTAAPLPGMPWTVTHRRLAYLRSPEQAWSVARAHADGETGYAIDGPNGSLTIMLRVMPYAPAGWLCHGNEVSRQRPTVGVHLAVAANGVPPRLQNIPSI